MARHEARPREHHLPRLERPRLPRPRLQRVHPAALRPRLHRVHQHVPLHLPGASDDSSCRISRPLPSGQLRKPSLRSPFPELARREVPDARPRGDVLGRRAVVIPARVVHHPLQARRAEALGLHPLRHAQLVERRPLRVVARQRRRHRERLAPLRVPRRPERVHPRLEALRLRQVLRARARSQVQALVPLALVEEPLVRLADEQLLREGGQPLRIRPRDGAHLPQQPQHRPLLAQRRRQVVRAPRVRGHRVLPRARRAAHLLIQLHHPHVLQPRPRQPPRRGQPRRPRSDDEHLHRLGHLGARQRPAPQPVPRLHRPVHDGARHRLPRPGAPCTRWPPPPSPGTRRSAPAASVPPPPLLLVVVHQHLVVRAGSPPPAPAPMSGGNCEQRSPASGRRGTQPLGQRRGGAAAPRAPPARSPTRRSEGTSAWYGRVQKPAAFSVVSTHQNELPREQRRGALHHRHPVRRQPLLQQLVEARGVQLAQREVVRVREVDDRPRRSSPSPSARKFIASSLMTRSFGCVSEWWLSSRQLLVLRGQPGDRRVQVHQRDRLAPPGSAAPRAPPARRRRRESAPARAEPRAHHGRVHQRLVVAVLVHAGELQVAVQEQREARAAARHDDALVRRAGCACTTSSA